MKKIIFLIALSFAATSISNEYNAEENAKCYTGNKTTSPIADQADAEVKCVAACSGKALPRKVLVDAGYVKFTVMLAQVLNT